MIPIFAQSDIKTYDQNLARKDLLQVAISRAGYSVCMLAMEMLEGGYGKRVVVLYGPGNNGKDALAAAGFLSSRGIKVKTVAYSSDEYFSPDTYKAVDLVIDGCFGIGISREFSAPPLGDATVLSIDLPSGLDGDSGNPVGSSIDADVTLCLTGLKPGVLIGQGKQACGELYLSELGLDDHSAFKPKIHLIEDSDVSRLKGRKDSDDHKWKHSVAVIAGSSGMGGAAQLVCASAYLNGAGIVHLYSGSSDSFGDYVIETVIHQTNLEVLSENELQEFIDNLTDRFKSVVIGPGLGRGQQVAHVLTALIGSKLRLVIDADGINALPSIEWLGEKLSKSGADVVLTPHYGELRSLLERSSSSVSQEQIRLGEIELALSLASKTGATFLIKGSPTIVASPDGTCFLTTAPTQSLAVAGSGDVLSGMIGAELAYQQDTALAAALAAHLHGLAGRSLSLPTAKEIAPRAREIALELMTEENFNKPRYKERPLRILGNLVAERR